MIRVLTISLLPMSVLSVMLMGAGTYATVAATADRCTEHRVVRSSLGRYLSSKMPWAIGRHRVVRYSLDDGHVYDRDAMEWTAATLARSETARPITNYLVMPGARVELCDSPTQTQGTHWYVLSRTGSSGAPEQSIVTRE